MCQKYGKTANGTEAFSKDIANVLTDVAKFSPRRRDTYNNNRVRTAKWYNYSLRSMKNEVLHISKLLGKYPKDPFVTGSFISKEKKYKSARKKAKREYWKCIATHLNTAEVRNSNNFWRLINSIKNQKHSSEPPSMHELESFFKRQNQISCNVDRQFMHKIENTVQSDTYRKKIISLDQPITIKELSKAILCLSFNKPCGWDLIANEMLKES